MNLTKAVMFVVGACLTSTMGMGDVQTSCIDKPGIVYKIAKREGWYVKGSLPRRLKNPGSLVYAHQRGASKHRSGFAKFNTDLAGWEALEHDVSYKKRHGKNFQLAWNYLKPFYW